MSFNPNDIGVANGNFCGLPVTQDEAELVIIPIPWDATASYGRGTSEGPDAILEASLQLDLYHHHYEKVYEKKVYMEPIDHHIKTKSEDFGKRTTEYIDFLSNGGLLEDSEKYQELLNEVTSYQKQIQADIYTKTKKYLAQGKKVALLGGEHSTPLGLIQAYAEEYENFGILQIDAHADLRDAYEGFEQSHASIMFNALKFEGLTKLVQVGIRDLCEDEVEIIKTNNRVKTYFDWDLKADQYKGANWHQQCVDIIQKLPENVYISFDIDGLIPALCPNTGTPVPGGLQYEQAVYLLQLLSQSGRKIVGFDLNEVAPGEDVINEIVGARMLMELMLCTMVS